MTQMAKKIQYLLSLIHHSYNLDNIKQMIMSTPTIISSSLSFSSFIFASSFVIHSVPWSPINPDSTPWASVTILISELVQANLAFWTIRIITNAHDVNRVNLFFWLLRSVASRPTATYITISATDLRTSEIIKSMCNFPQLPFIASMLGKLTDSVFFCQIIKDAYLALNLLFHFFSQKATR